MVSRSDNERFGSAFLEDIIDWITSNFDPDDVYSETALEEWAQKSGYIKSEED